MREEGREPTAQGWGAFSIFDLTAAAMRHRLKIALSLLAGSLVGVVFAFLREPTYSMNFILPAHITLPPNNADVVNKLLSDIFGQNWFAKALETELESALDKSSPSENPQNQDFLYFLKDPRKEPKDAAAFAPRLKLLATDSLPQLAVRGRPGDTIAVKYDNLGHYNISVILGHPNDSDEAMSLLGSALRQAIVAANARMRTTIAESVLEKAEWLKSSSEDEEKALMKSYVELTNHQLRLLAQLYSVLESARKINPKSLPPHLEVSLENRNQFQKHPDELADGPKTHSEAEFYWNVNSQKLLSLIALAESRKADLSSTAGLMKRLLSLNVDWQNTRLAVQSQAQRIAGLENEVQTLRRSGTQKLLHQTWTLPEITGSPALKNLASKSSSHRVLAAYGLFGGLFFGVLWALILEYRSVVEFLKRHERRVAMGHRSVA